MQGVFDEKSTGGRAYNVLSVLAYQNPIDREAVEIVGFAVKVVLHELHGAIEAVTDLYVRDSPLEVQNCSHTQSILSFSLVLSG